VNTIYTALNAEMQNLLTTPANSINVSIAAIAAIGANLAGGYLPIKKSIKSDFKDFEDAIQYNCAKSLSKIDFIVTRDTKDFKSSSLPILTPKEAVSLVESTSR
jgi:hypothetical protein